MRSNTQTFFGLKDPVFTRPPAAPYSDPDRKKLAEQLANLVQRRGFAVLTAPAGCGKTATLHYLANSLNDNYHRIYYVPFSFLEQANMLQFMAVRMGLEAKRGMTASLRQIQKHLDDIQPVNPVIVLDEAERLEIQTISILRMIVNDRPDTTHHCTLIMAGADSFVHQKLSLNVNEPLRQRITLYLRLRPLQQQQTRSYIEHYLKQAGAPAELFDPPATMLIHELTNGVPRMINTLAETAMDIAAELQQRRVTLENIHQAAEYALPTQTQKNAL